MELTSQALTNDTNQASKRSLISSNQVLSILFIPVTIVVYCAILFSLISDYLIALIFYSFAATQLIFIMLSDISDRETVKKMRVGRMVLYSFGFAIGVVALTFLFIIVFSYLLPYGISSLSSFNVDALAGFILVGCIIFIFSLWGFQKEERYGTGGKMRGTALFYTNIIFLFYSFFFLIFQGLLYIILYQDIVDLHPEYDPIIGILYIPVGIILFTLSAIKLRRDYHYRKQFY